MYANPWSKRHTRERNNRCLYNVLYGYSYKERILCNQNARARRCAYRRSPTPHGKSPTIGSDEDEGTHTRTYTHVGAREGFSKSERSGEIHRSEQKHKQKHKQKIRSQPRSTPTPTLRHPTPIPCVYLTDRPALASSSSTSTLCCYAARACEFECSCSCS